MHWQHHRSDWAIIQSHAPHFTSVLEALNERKFNSPDPIDDLPECLNLKSKNTFDSDHEWQQYLDSEHPEGISVREMYLRVLLMYAVSDQGADINGVRFFIDYFLKECYAHDIFLFENRPRMGDPAMIRIAKEGAKIAAEKFAEDWAKQGGRKASQYSVFTVDGIRGQPSANWYVNSRLGPALTIAHQSDGGLTALLSNHQNPKFQHSWEAVRQSIRQHPTHGIFQAIGPKGLHLYMKWVFGTFALIPSESSIPPEQLPIPMDQRIGKVLMRCGFMDEFYSIEKSILSKKFLYTSNNGPAAKLTSSGAPPDERTFLRVANFRDYNKIDNEHLLSLLIERYPSSIKSSKPQTTLVLLLELMKSEYGRHLTIHELDNLLMVVADYCHDRDPECSSCPISEQCQANNATGKSYLKKYYT